MTQRRDDGPTHEWASLHIAHLRVDVEGLTIPAHARSWASVLREMAQNQRDRGNHLDANLFYGVAEGLTRWATDVDAEHRGLVDAFRQQLDSGVPEDLA